MVLVVKLKVAIMENLELELVPGIVAVSVNMSKVDSTRELTTVQVEMLT